MGIEVPRPTRPRTVTPTATQADERYLPPRGRHLGVVRLSHGTSCRPGSLLQWLAPLLIGVQLVPPRWFSAGPGTG
jgi:hypothetical protein